MASSSAAATKSSAAASSSATSSSSGGAATAASAANTTPNRGPYQIWVHDITAFGGADLVLSKDAFPHVTGDGELVEIRDQNDNAVVIRVDTPPILLKGNMQISISKRISTQFNLAPRQVVSVSVLDANDKEKITLESVELSFKDQYVGRADLFHMSNGLVGTCVYTGMQVTYGNIRAKVQSLLHREQSQHVHSGLISKDTRFVFRSRSAKIFLFIQMSKEMMDYGDDGLLYCERAVSVFLPELFARWKEAGTSHSIYLVLFGRSYCVDAGGIESDNADDLASSSDANMTSAAASSGFVSNKHRSREDDCTRVDCFGRRYRDWYKVIVDEQTRDDWQPILAQLKKEMTRFPPDCVSARGANMFDTSADDKDAEQRHRESGIRGTKSNAVATAAAVAASGSTGGSFRTARRRMRNTRGKWVNSCAAQGNLLEAINLALGVFDRHHIDRHLRRTGMDIIVVSAGTGFFEVDAQLAVLTKQRMVDVGIGCDLICLGKPPLHVVPLFMYQNPNLSPTDPLVSFDPNDSGGVSGALSSGSGSGSGSKAKTAVEHSTFKIPHWIYISFYTQPIRHTLTPTTTTTTIQLPNSAGTLKSSKAGKELRFFTPYLRMPNLQQTNELTQDVSSRSDPAIPQLHNSRHRRELSTAASPAFHSPVSLSPPSPFRDGADSPPTSPRGTVESAQSSLGSGGVAEILRANSLAVDVVSNRANDSATVRNSAPGTPIRVPEERLSFTETLYPKSTTPSGFGAALHTAGTILQQQQQQQQQQQAPKRSKVNPFKYYHAPPTPSSTRRRWMHLFPRNMAPADMYTTATVSAPLYTSDPNWKSLSEPACVPLTTDYFPSESVIQRAYMENVYILSLLPDENTYQNNTEDLLKELISQRLAQNFQIVGLMFEDGSKTMRPSKQQQHQVTYLLSLGTIFHKIIYDPREQNVVVKRYHPRNQSGTAAGKPQSKITYTYWLWPSTSSEDFDSDGRDLTERRKNYIPAVVDFSYAASAPATFNWNIVDHLICGYQQGFSPALRSWKINFAIIPGIVRGTDASDRSGANANSTSSAEQIAEMIRAFEKFKDMLLKRKPFTSNSLTLDVEVQSRDLLLAPSTSAASGSTPPSGASAVPSAASLGVGLARASSPALVSPMASRTTSRKDTGDASWQEPLERLDERQELEQLVSDMRHPKSGVPIQDRTKLFRTYRRCFVGSEAVDWVLRSAGNRLQSYSREEAANLCARMMNAGFIVHVTPHTTGPFEDGYHFYRFFEDKQTLDIRRESLRLRRRMSKQPTLKIASTELDPADLHAALLREQEQQLSEVAASAPPDVSSPEPTFETLLQRSKDEYLNRTISMKSVKLVLDDNTAGSRYQWLQLHYDSVFHPDICFRISVEWMICTASAIQAFMIKQCYQVAKLCGLYIVQVPVDRDIKSDPFRSPVHIYMPQSAEVDRVDLLSKLNFVVYCKSAKGVEYVHRTGVAFVYLVEDGLVWTYNYTPTLQPMMTKAAALLRQLKDLCADLLPSSALEDSDDSDSENESDDADSVSVDSTAIAAVAAAAAGGTTSNASGNTIASSNASNISSGNELRTTSGIESAVVPTLEVSAALDLLSSSVDSDGGSNVPAANTTTITTTTTTTGSATTAVENDHDGMMMMLTG